MDHNRHITNGQPLKREETEEIEIFNLIRVPIAKIDPKTRRFLWVSPAFCALLGYREAELLTLTENEINYPDDQLDQLEKRYLKQDGSIIWVIATENIIQDAQGEPIYIFKIVQEISDRQRLEAEGNEKNKELLRFALELNAVGIWEWEIGTENVTWSPETYQFYGYQPGEIEINFPRFWSHVHPDDQEEVKKRIYQAIESNTDYEAEFRIVRRDGSIVWLQNKASTLYDDKGRGLRMFGLSFDITERKIRQLNELFLTELDMRLRHLCDHHAMLWEAIKRLGQYLQVERVVWHEINVERDITIVTQDWRRETEIPSVVNTYTLSEFILPDLIKHYQLGETSVVDNVATHPYTAPFADKFAKQDIQAFVGVPCISEGRWVAILAIHARTPQTWRAEHITLLQSTVVRIWPLIEQTKAIQALKEKELEYHQILDSIADLVFVKQTDSRLVWANQAFREYYGLSLEALKGMIDAPFNNPEYTQQYLEDDSFVFSTGQVLNIPEEFITSHDGQISTFSTVKAPIYDENGQVILLVGVSRDITDRQQAELMLEQQLKKEQMLGEMSQAIRQTLDLNQILQTTTEQIREFLQTDRVIIFKFKPDWSGKVVSESVKDESLAILGSEINDPCFGENYVESYRQGRISAIADFSVADVQSCYKEFMTQCQVRANLVVPISQREELWGLLIAHHCHGPRLWYADEIDFLTQLTTQLGIGIQQAELYQKNAEQAALIDIASDGIFVRDLSNRIIFWSLGAERLYGWKRTEAIGQTTSTLFERQFLPQLETVLQTTLEQGTWRGEVQQFTKTGKKITVESRWTLMHDSQRLPCSILVVNTDITEKKRLEKQLLQAQRLESIGTLSMGIAHDLNNILTPLLGLAQLLPLKILNLDESTLKLLDILQSNTQRGADMVKQLLLFSSLAEPQFTLISISLLLEELLKLIRETFPKSILIESVIARDLWMVKGDSTQLHQVVMNLCVNARDAMPDGGRLIILAHNLEIDKQYSITDSQMKIGKYVVITIKDTGMGIAPELINRIFDPFFTTKGIGQGTGLGLSTALTIVKNHEGIIDVKSDRRKDRGTQFQIYLPATNSTNTPLNPTNDIIVSGEQESILVVDDEAPIREITKITLETHNYRVITAEDGIDAISIYAQKFREIQVVLMDLIMPEIDGLKAMRALKKINPDVKIIATSGLSTSELINKAEYIGIKGFLVKPYSKERLLSLLRKVVSDPDD